MDPSPIQCPPRSGAVSTSARKQRKGSGTGNCTTCRTALARHQFTAINCTANSTYQAVDSGDAEGGWWLGAGVWVALFGRLVAGVRSLPGQLAVGGFVLDRLLRRFDG